MSTEPSRGSDRASLLIVMFAFAAALGGFWAGLKFFGNDPAVGTQAPEFSLRDSNGKLVALSDFRGRKVMINFWATWCPPCVEEMPMLDALATARSDDLVVLGIAEDDPQAVVDFLKLRPVGYPILQSASEFVSLSTQFGNSRNVLPYSVLVDAQGVVQRSKSGMFSKADLERFVR
jgi:thiol-disulfide isomerase/thioredoxin